MTPSTTVRSTATSSIGSFIANPKKIYTPKKNEKEMQSVVLSASPIVIIKQWYNRQPVALLLSGTVWSMVSFINGTQKHLSKKEGVITPTFSFTYKSSTYAQGMHSAAMLHAVENYPELQGQYATTISSQFVGNGLSESKVNFVVGPKCILSEGIHDICYNKFY